jgi:hypothetical protein
MAYTRKIKGVSYTLYKDEKEFRRHNPKQTIQSDWRGANTGDWIKTDDGQVTVVIKRGKIKTRDRKKIILVRQLIDKEIELLLNETGITKSYLLEKTKDIVDSEGSKDSDRMRAIETLMKLSGMLSTEKKVDSVSLIQEFTGFSQEKLEAFRAGVLLEPPKPAKLNGKKT